MMNVKSIFISFLLTVTIGLLNVNGQTTTSNEVKSLIKKKIQYNKKNGYGFRIQLFYGSEVKAKTELKSFNIQFPNIKTYIDYSSPPNWKSLVGDYKTKLEADKILNNIKLKFSSAIVVPR
jgi:hypothetical protein